MEQETQNTDEYLAGQARENAAAFGLLMERYESPLLRYIHRVVLVTREDAEDILQEAFLKAYQNINDFDTSLAFSSWMYRITHNTAISAWRKTKARPQGHTIEVDDTFWTRIVADDDIALEADQKIDQGRVAQIIEQMDEKYRSVLVLFFLEEKSYKEISDILKKPMGTIATLVNRAKKQFRKECEKQGISFEHITS